MKSTLFKYFNIYKQIFLPLKVKKIKINNKPIFNNQLVSIDIDFSGVYKIKINNSIVPLQNEYLLSDQNGIINIKLVGIFKSKKFTIPLNGHGLTIESNPIYYSKDSHALSIVKNNNLTYNKNIKFVKREFYLKRKLLLTAKPIRTKLEYFPKSFLNFKT